MSMSAEKNKKPDGGKKKKKKSTTKKKDQKDTPKKSPKKGSESGPEEEKGEEKAPHVVAPETIAKVKELLTEFRKSLQKDQPELYKCSNLLTQLKILMIQFQLIPPFTGSVAATKEQLELARSVLELACTLSIKTKDYKAFERHVTQVKTYYTDYGHLLDRSEAEFQIVGLHLLGLLAHNRVADFHTELELIPVESWSNMYIDFSLQLEQRLMEGNYNKVLRARKTLPMADFEYFADMLVRTVREKISDCCEKSYESIPLEDARQMLMFDTVAELHEHITKRKWIVRENFIRFTLKDRIDEALTIPSELLARNHLQYATELERIV